MSAFFIEDIEVPSTMLIESQYITLDFKKFRRVITLLVGT
jgi:hypothetical protein